jgi:metal-responsive CopG/Arc/MetJ family transcriptional regulator
MAAMRTIVDLPEEQIQALKRLSEQSKLSRAELTRRAVAEYLRHHQADGIEDAFGIWKNHRRDSLDYQRRLREEWEE